MIRFIIKRRCLLNSGLGLETEDLITLDAIVPELETLLRDGGYSSNEYQINDLIGAELLEPPKKEGKE